jgi:hydroxymethylpyrimidine pyrophosphatase-like HAD family hydrolase
MRIVKKSRGRTDIFLKIKLIALDLDGSLFRSDKTISKYTVDVLRRCQEKEIKIAIVTAFLLCKLTTIDGH